MYKHVCLVGVTLASVQAAHVLFAKEPAAKPSTTRPVYATPAAAVAAAQQASRHDDFEAEVDCFSPNGQTGLAKTFLHLLVSMPPEALSSSPMGKSIAAIEARYGLKDRGRKPGETDDQLIDRLTDRIADKRAFVLDTLALNKGHNDLSRAAAELEEVRVEDGGNTAVGKLVRHEGAATVSQDVHFKTVGGSFVIDNAVFF